MTTRHLTFPLTTRAAKSGEYAVTITTNDRDRMGDVLEPSGAQTANYQRAGMPLLLAHRHDQLPIGRGVSLRPTANGIDMTFRFLANDEVAQRAENAWRQGALAGASVGLLPLASEPLGKGRGLHILKWDLLEVSLTATPANPSCVATLKALGLPVSGDEIVLPLVVERALPESQDATWPQAVVTARQLLTDFLASLGDEAKQPTYTALHDVVERLTAWLERRTDGKAARGSGLVHVNPNDVRAVVAEQLGAALRAGQIGDVLRTELKRAINAARGRLD